MTKLISSFALLLLLSACSYTTQATSGRAYLEQYKDVPVSDHACAGGVNIDKEIRKIAAVEPTLSFPARIGLARIEGGRLTALDGEELEAWEDLKNKLGSGYGEFIPVNPMIAEMVSSNIATTNKSGLDDVIAKIRLGAARQHLDAVLIYEVYDRSNQNANLLSIADLTIIGAFILPSRAVNAEGFASAILIDVVQGYPYGTVEGFAEKGNMATTAGSRSARNKTASAAKLEAVRNMSAESEKMFRDLRLKLAEQHDSRKK